jgi:hypothetical protein
MNIDSIYRQTKSCWCVPTCRCFALRVNIDASASVHDAYVRQNDFGIDDLNEYLRLLMGQIDDSSVGENPQIPIACTLI